MGISFGNINGIADQNTPPPAGGGKGGGVTPMPGSGISIPGQGFQMQPQQFMQVPYAQQYAQQGNINDPSVYAALEALNAPAYVAQPTQRYGSGITNQTGGGKGGGAPMIKDWRTRLPPPVAAPAVMPGSGDGGGSYDGGGYSNYGGGYDDSFYSGTGLGSNNAPVENMGTDTGFGGMPTMAPVESMGTDTGFGGYGDSSGQGTNANGGYGAGGYGAADDFGGFGADTSGGGGGGDSSKIVCTAMNNAYGFGSFRNAIWLKYASKHLTKAHEAGYHALFLPLVDYGFKQGDATPNRLVRKCLEHVARHRSADLRAEMRGMKRDALGRAYRFVLEPLCLVVGKLKGY